MSFRLLHEMMCLLPKLGKLYVHVDHFVAVPKERIQFECGVTKACRAHFRKKIPRKLFVTKVFFPFKISRLKHFHQ